MCIETCLRSSFKYVMAYHKVFIVLLLDYIKKMIVSFKVTPQAPHTRAQSSLRLIFIWYQL